MFFRMGYGTYILVAAALLQLYLPQNEAIVAGGPGPVDVGKGTADLRNRGSTYAGSSSEAQVSTSGGTSVASAHGSSLASTNTAGSDVDEDQSGGLLDSLTGGLLDDDPLSAVTGILGSGDDDSDLLGSLTGGLFGGGDLAAVTKKKPSG